MGSVRDCLARTLSFDGVMVVDVMTVFVSFSLLVFTRHIKDIFLPRVEGASPILESRRLAATFFHPEVAIHRRAYNRFCGFILLVS